MVLLRYRDPTIGPLVTDALTALGAGDGFVDGWVGRSPDDPHLWVLGARWRDPGALRRGLGSFEAKVALGRLQSFSAGEDVVVEILAAHDGARLQSLGSDLAPDAGEAGPRRAVGPE